MRANNKTQARRKKAPRKPNERIRELESEYPGRSQRHSKLQVYFAHHLWVAVSTLGHLWRAPFSTVMTSLVIAIALALPTGLYVLLKNIQQVSSAWENTAQISVFLQQPLPNAQIQQLHKQLLAWEQIESVRYISAEQAMADFKQQSGFGDVLGVLHENPLPAVLVIKPTADLSQHRQIESLVERLKQLKQVDQVVLDMDWVRRLGAILDVGERGVYLLGVLLAVAILLVVGNTIRLTIFNRREEIIVSKLIGATNQFIRRPFLYTGFWYGLFGAGFAWLLVVVFLKLLKSPIEQLAVLYESHYSISGLGGFAALTLLALGILLGLLGSWLAVGRHLQMIEPT